MRDLERLTEEVNMLRHNLPIWTSRYIKIRSKQEGRLVPFIFNRAQIELHNFLENIRRSGNPVRANVVKGRQMGISTYIASRFLHRATLNRGVSVFILAHISKSTDYLFDMVKRMHSNLPELLQPSVAASNKKELKFGAIDSEYALGTAESKEIGRGMTPLLLHCSEAAFYSNTKELQTGLLQGVPYVPGSEVIFESTANGIANNMFYGLCMRGVENKGDLSQIQTLFLPWYWMDDYRRQPPPGFKPTQEELELMEVYGLDLSQVAWRRGKLENEFNGDLWMFRQEYPMYLLDAFVASGESLIAGEAIEQARKNNINVDEFSPKVLGVDGADSKDRIALVLRQGKKVLWHKVYKNLRPMNLAGMIARSIDKEGIDMVFLDVAYGFGTRDRLRELGYAQQTQTVHFGESALEPEIYRNKRAQMYGYIKEWIEEGGADIPDDHEFARDLQMIPAFEQTGSKGLLTLPSKAIIKKENGGVSPDIADALGLTFAYPVKRRQGDARIAVKEPRATQPHSYFKTRRLASRHVDEKPSELYIK